MITMGEIKTISYADWLKYVRASYEKGRHCNEFKVLQCSSPILLGTDDENYVWNELAKLESKFIKAAVDGFQNAVNKSLEETDVYIFERGIKEFKKNIIDCVFFDGIEGYSAAMKSRLKESIRFNFMLFIDEFAKYIKKLMEFENDSYINEVIYIYKKANIKKFIQERTVYE